MHARDPYDRLSMPALAQSPARFTRVAEESQRSVYRLLGREWTIDLVLTLGGRREKVNSPNGILAVELPEGRCEFTIEKPQVK